MAKIGIFEETQRKWFPYDADTEVLLEYIEKGRVNTILMQGAEAAKKMKTKPGHMQDIFLGKAAVLGWRHKDDQGQPGFALPDGTPLPFSPENRNRVMTKSRKFSEWVYATCTNEDRFLEDQVLELDAEDLKGLDELLEDLKEEEPGKEELPGNV